MISRYFNYSFLLLVLLVLLLTAVSCEKEAEPVKKPNMVLIFLDDGAYADFEPFGVPRYPTPNVKQLASEGCRYYNFYVPQAICSASRAALLSGCYPGRTGVFGAHGPHGRGLDTTFATMGEVFQANGYQTAIFGKWHIGDQPDTRPPARGFTESCGLMYSNDMWKYHPENPEHWGKFPLQFWENGQVTIDTMKPADQRNLTTWYTEHAVNFISKHKDQPFFLYVPHSMPHVPIFCSDKFKGKSGTGLYGDVMMELDWSVGQINQAIKDNGLEKNTIFIFIGSDNGPWLSYGDHAGQTPYREGKGTIFDGGVRNSCIIKYPGNIQPGSASHNTFSTIDILPTLCNLTNTPLPKNTIDGNDIWSLATNQEGATNSADYYPFSNGSQFQGVISADGKWKLHIPHPYRTVVSGGKGGFPGKYQNIPIDTALFDMVHDPYEKENQIKNYPEMAEKLLGIAQKHYDRFFKMKED